MIELHPALALIPVLSPTERAELLEDVRNYGLRLRPVRQNGVLLDGRGRLEVLDELGIKPEFLEYEGDPFRYVISANVHRRSLSTAQKLVLTARLLKLGRGRPAKNRKCADYPTAKEAAHLTDLDLRSLESTKTVVNRGVPELVQAVEQGDIAPSTAAEIAKHAPERQREIVKAAKKETKGYALALARGQKTATRASIAQRLSDVDLSALTALAELGRTKGSPQARAGVLVLQRIVPAVKR